MNLRRQAGFSLVKAGLIGFGKGMFRATFISGANGGMALSGAARTALGYEVGRTGADLMTHGLSGESMISAKVIDSVTGVFKGDWGVSLTFTQAAPDRSLELKAAIPIMNQEFAGLSLKSPALGAEIAKTNAAIVRYSKQEVNDSFYIGYNSKQQDLVYGSRQEFDLFKDKIGGVKFSAGFRYSSGHSVPSVNIGWEFPSKTAINLEFRGK